MTEYHYSNNIEYFNENYEYHNDYSNNINIDSFNNFYDYDFSDNEEKNINKFNNDNIIEKEKIINEENNNEIENKINENNINEKTIYKRSNKSNNKRNICNEDNSKLKKQKRNENLCCICSKNEKKYKFICCERYYCSLLCFNKHNKKKCLDKKNKKLKKNKKKNIKDNKNNIDEKDNFNNENDENYDSCDDEASLSSSSLTEEEKNNIKNDLTLKHLLKNNYVRNVFKNFSLMKYEESYLNNFINDPVIIEVIDQIIKTIEK